MIVAIGQSTESFAEEQIVDSNEQAIQVEVIDDTTMSSTEPDIQKPMGERPAANNLPSTGEVVTTLVSFLGVFLLGGLLITYVFKKRRVTK